MQIVTDPRGPAWEDTRCLEMRSHPGDCNNLSGRANAWHVGSLVHFFCCIRTPSHSLTPVSTCRPTVKSPKPPPPIPPGSLDSAKWGVSCKWTWCDAASFDLSPRVRPPQQQLQTTTACCLWGLTGLSQAGLLYTTSTCLRSISDWAELEGLGRPPLSGALALPCMNSPCD